VPKYPDLSGLIKSYDVRGVVGESLTEEVALAIGAAFADAVVIPDGHTAAVVGRDMRASSPSLEAAVVEGMTLRGVDVISVGLCSTDGLYFASGSMDLPGLMITASHNPAPDNGMKMCHPQARAVGETTGLGAVRELTARYLVDGIPPADRRGAQTHQDVLADYAAFLRSLVDLREIRPLRVVVDAANAMAGHTVPAVLGTVAGLPDLPIKVLPLYFELDGTFPHHEANPLDERNLVDLQAAVREHGADLGLAFDGDADRCFVIDERGEVVKASTIATLVGLREARRELAAGRTPTIIHNLICSKAVTEQLQSAGATTVRAKVGHSHIKAQMAEHDAVFGGEHSAHFYFRDFWFADSGLLAAMHVLATVGEQPGPLSQLLQAHDPYANSGEINSRVDSVDDAMARIREAFASDEAFLADELTVDRFDGLTVSHWNDDPQWWFNVRASNTEPLLRLNVEARDRAVMERQRDAVLAVIRQADAHALSAEASALPPDSPAPTTDTPTSPADTPAQTTDTRSPTAKTPGL